MKQVYMDTFGCQMNVADSDRMELLLFHSGYSRTPHMEDADLILVNTCSIREKAEQKVFSLFGGIKSLKKTNPNLVMGLTGCLAQQDGERLLKRIPFLDFILGPDHVEDIPLAVDRVLETNTPLIWNDFDNKKNYSIPPVLSQSRTNANPSAFVNIIKGCDKFCSFCVVPFTRGREKSREAKEIYDEIRQQVALGAKEIILLGQNVNAYGKRGLETEVAFHELLYGIAKIPGVMRLRFTTSYPGDVTQELLKAYADIDILSNHLHLPAQSGNNRVLSAMRRGNTVEEYLALIETLKTHAPDIELSTDIIVGFPGETEREFEDTLTFMEQVEFSSSYMFCYSPRPGTPAAEFQDDVPEPVKKERLKRTIECQSRLTARRGEKFLGTEVEVLVEGQVIKKGTRFLKGRTPHYWQTNFSGEENRYEPGDLVKVNVEKVSGHGLMGQAVV
jgi:tRNA-2-methylthio-N6-dimethylallyladenosine synthase